MLEELAREIEAKITALRNRNIIDDEQYYRIKSLVDHPELIKGLELNTIIILFNELRINNSVEKISRIKGIPYTVVVEQIQKTIGYNNFYDSVTSVYRNM